MRYLVKHQKDDSLKMILTFSESKFLEKWEVFGNWMPEAWRWVFQNAPVHEDEFLKRWKGEKVLLISPVAEDTSFSVFWDEYGKKMGNRPRTEKLWNALTEEERISALAALPRYRHYLAHHPAIEQAHASTWLNQRRWENEYK